MKSIGLLQNKFYKKYLKTYFFYLKNNFLFKVTMNQKPESMFFSRNIENKTNNNINLDNKNFTLDDIDNNELWEFYDEIGSSESSNTKRDLGVCISCGSKDQIENGKTRNIVCKNCGMNIVDDLDRTFSTNNSNADIVSNSSNYNIPINYFFKESSMGTIIGGRGNSRIKTIHRWSLMPYRERSRKEVFDFITNICRKGGLAKSIIDNAHILYMNLSGVKKKDVDRTIIIRGNNRDSLIAACVYFGCKMQGKPRCPKEIAQMFGLGLTDVTGGCRKFLEIMGKDVGMYNIKSSKAYDYIERCGKKLKLQKKYIDEAVKIVKNIITLDYASDHQPPSVAAGCLLLVVNMNNLDIDREQISKVFKISQVTITKIYDKISKYSKVITNDESVARIYKQIQKIKLGTESEEGLVYSESNIFTVSASKEKIKNNEVRLITTSPDEVSAINQTETETDTETMIKPGKKKRKYTKRKKKSSPSI